MGKIAKISIVVGIVAVLSLSGASIWYFFIRESKQPPDIEQNVVTATTYSIADSTPPALSTYLSDTFLTLGWEESAEDADVSVNYMTGTADLESTSGIDLFQVWILTRPFEKSLENVTYTVCTISDTVDSDDPTKLLSEPTGDSDSTQVSLETKNSDNCLTLTTLQKANSITQTVAYDSIDPLTPETWKHPTAYPLISRVHISGDATLLAKIETSLDEGTFLADHHYSRELPSEGEFVTVIKTGTSVIGGPGWTFCESRTGRIDYPIDHVKSKLSTADLTIISNEASFVDGCSQAAGTTSFCGKPSYLQNMLTLGVDVVSLTGNHMADYGRTAYEQTVATYEENNISYFGAGDTTAASWQPLTVETNAGTIGFVGYNAMGPGGVLSTESTFGSAYYDTAQLASAMTTAGEQADIVWVDNHLWPEYGTTPSDEQITRGREAIDLGADIVTGVSSHEIQGAVFYGGSPIWYGLGNFLFDQMWSDETRWGIVLEATLYDNAIREIDLHPTVMHDSCQPKFAVGDERIDLLEYIFSISTFSER